MIVNSDKVAWRSHSRFSSVFAVGLGGFGAEAVARVVFPDPGTSHTETLLTRPKSSLLSVTYSSVEKENVADQRAALVLVLRIGFGACGFLDSCETAGIGLLR